MNLSFRIITVFVCAFLMPNQVLAAADTSSTMTAKWLHETCTRVFLV